MGECDLKEKLLMDCNDVFAEIWNILGKDILLRPEDLTDAPTESISFSATHSRSTMRDILKCYKDSMLRLVYLGIENQTGIDIFMPLRVMEYDCGVYRKQLAQKRNSP